jgi:galactose mutarotase-like enzyme
MTIRSRVVDIAVQGFPALKLTTNILSLTIVPELGGKISSLRDLRNGREWLWTNDRLPHRKHAYGSSYNREADSGGWDECFPSVAACPYPLDPWRGKHIPDHGEIWSQEWMTGVNGDDSTVWTIRTEAVGTAMPYAFERTITASLDSPVLHFDYCVKNRSDAPLAFIWSAHPLLRIEPGMRLLLPEGARMHVGRSVPEDRSAHEKVHTWPARLRLQDKDCDLTELPAPDGGIACKLWSEPLTEGYAALVASDGELRFTFDPKAVPQVGVWLNAGAWSGAGGDPYYNLALEPCIGAQDSLQEAVARELYRVLPPRGISAWSMKVHLKSSVA